jgi:cysteine sulfinate desulfinase/cysteine desulfurase-like protein
MAGIIQRAMNNSSNGEDLLISDAEKEALLETIQQLDKQVEEVPVKKLYE